MDRDLMFMLHERPAAQIQTRLVFTVMGSHISLSKCPGSVVVVVLGIS